jgi:hypothetical protein
MDLSSADFIDDFKRLYAFRVRRKTFETRQWECDVTFAARSRFFSAQRLW